MDIVVESSRIAEKVSFTTYCRLLEKLVSNDTVKAREKILSKFLTLWENQYFTLYPKCQYPSSGRASLYLLLRLLVPSYDRLRKAFGLREHTLSRLIIKAIGLAPNSLAARKLSRIQPYIIRRHSDFADVAYTVLKTRCREDNILSVKDINSHLDNLTSAESSDVRLQVLRSLLHSTTALEQKWIIRLIIKRDSGCGLNGRSILKCFHPAAFSIFEVTQDLFPLCERIANIPATYVPTECSKDLTNLNSVTLFVPFRPMLCERANSADTLINAALHMYGKQNQGNAMSLNLLFETKFDGERVQLHKSNGFYRYWSRNGLEWTASYGADATRDFDRLSARLHCGFAQHVNDCILDGEMMIFNNWSKTLMSKPTKFDVKRSSYQNSNIDNYQPCFIVFDILYLNAQLLTSTSLLERKKLLSEVFSLNSSLLADACMDTYGTLDFYPTPIINGVLYVSKWYTAPARQNEVARAFNHLVDNHQEGLIVKIANSPSPYLPGIRTDGGWWKIKPDYIQGLLEDLDCLIVGGYFHHCGNKIITKVNHFLCAVRGDGSTAEENVNLPRFYTFCKVKSGLTIKQLKEINNLLGKHWKMYDRKHPNSDSTEWLCVNSERPDVWIPPESSLVLQLHGAELTQSDSYSSGLTLRFPRVVAIRHDKCWRDSMSLSELIQLNTETEGKLATKRLSVVQTFSGLTEGQHQESFTSMINAADNSNQSSGYHTLNEITEQQTTVQFIEVDKPLATSSPIKRRVDSCDKHSNFFKNHEICLWLSNDIELDKKLEYESSICNYGGIVVQNPSHSTFCIVADKLTLKVKNLLNYPSTSKKRPPSIDYNVVRLHWLVACINKKSLLAWKPKDMFSMSSSVAARMALEYDKFGDSYSEFTTPDELKLIFDDISCFPSVTNEMKDTSKLTVPILSHYSKLKLLLDEFPNDMEVLHPLTGYILVLIRPLFNLQNKTKMTASASLELQQQLMTIDLHRLGSMCIGPIGIDKSVSVSNLRSILNSAYHNFLSIDSHNADCMRSLSNNCINPTHIILLSTPPETEFNIWLSENYSILNSWIHQFTRIPHLVKDSWLTECINQNSWCPELNHLVQMN
ncbi:DNA ligase 4 [Schistosoma japonicum]|uniref:DNA ligase n=2 Tax=Schistosoma japonicum TaxID=6182 RepID=A0A4Z2DWB7_SCHJA|nr:DNA ligase 4 [Schistosoma japonicum]